VREQRRFRRLRRAAIIGLAMLTVLAVAAASIAFVQRQEAWTRVDRDYERIHIDMQTLFNDLVARKPNKVSSPSVRAMHRRSVSVC
jgi:hypothetical protein